LPQLHKLHNKRVVIKLGGSCLDDEALMKNLLEDIALLTMVGAKILVVHGGGKEISKTLDKMNLKSEFYGGYRVTGDEEMNVVEMVLSGSVNKKIVERFSQSDIQVVGISGADGNILTAAPKYINGKSLGRVGDITKVDTSLVNTLFDKDYTVVLSPVGRCSSLGTVNINADDAAGQMALAINADYLVYITDVNGIFLDSQNEKTALEKITVEKAKMLLDSGLAKGGMIPKLTNIINLIENGVKEVAVLNGRVRYNIISEFIGAKTMGTVVTGD
jgi:acetylglutamate kinase